MRLGLRSYNPLVWALEAFGVLPAPLVVAFWGMESSRALIAAVELGLFDALLDRPRTAAALAADLGYDESGVEALLDALNGFGYLKRRDGVYSLRRSAKRWLTTRARFSMVRPFGLFGVLWGELDDIEERVRSGGARDFHADRTPEFWRRYEIGLGEAARLTASSIARSVKLDSPPARLLDVGGGHGAFTAAFCERHPGLTATVLDLPGAAAVGRELTAARGLTDRVTYVEGDLTADDWGSGYDVVLVFNVLHVLTPEKAADAVAKAHSALVPGGTLAIVDAVHAEGRRGDVGAVAGGSELLFYVINGTRAYPEATILEWVRSAGFENVRRKRLLAMPEALITARKADGDA
ncbi:MAG: methyltransferase [Coriobacteriia bacterium]|nr:methyltransferase [Coriobacteriia bacterium]